jgi:tannase/feruloyl esterase
MPNAENHATVEEGSASYCKISLVMTLSTDSDIRAEVWLPLTGWNGKYLAIGNGGWGGDIPSELIQTGLRRRYATSGTDDGHSGPSGRFVLGHPEKLIEMVLKSKAIIRAYYDRQPRYSY